MYSAGSLTNSFISLSSSPPDLRVLRHLGKWVTEFLMNCLVIVSLHTVSLVTLLCSGYISDAISLWHYSSYLWLITSDSAYSERPVD